MINLIKYILNEGNHLFINRCLKKVNYVRYVMFLALFSFSLHLFLKTFDTNVLHDILPEIITESFFSTLSLYNYICFIFITFYFIKRFRFLTFVEIHENKWYTFVKAGYSPIHMIFIKLFYRLLEVQFFYTIGYIIVFIFTTFLRYPLSLDYLLPLYFAGSVDILFFVITAMAISLFMKRRFDIVISFIIISIGIQVIKITGKFYSIIADPASMHDICNLLDFTKSNYVLSVMIIVLFSCLMILIIARKYALNTRFYFNSKDFDFDETVQIVIDDGTSFKKIKKKHYLGHYHMKYYDIVISMILRLIIVLLIIFNVIVLTVSITSMDRNWNFLNIDPYVFRSESMMPQIMYNDLTFFRTVQDKENVKEQDIILYRDGINTVNIARIIEKEKDKIIVDIDQYPQDMEIGLHQEELHVSQIEGTYLGRSRWLGLLVVFANTVIGRLLMMLLPSILIFFYQPILKKINELRLDKGGRI